MEDNAKIFESLFDRAAEYGKTSFELVKLKALDKSSEVVSSLVPHSVALIVIASSVIFLNLGIALWLGDIMGKMFYGFFTVAGFYILAGIVIHFFFHKRIKRQVSNYIINRVLNQVP